MALRASSSSYHINKARNWIAKPMLVKLTIRKKKLLLVMMEVVLILSEKIFLNIQLHVQNIWYCDLISTDTVGF